MEYYMIGVVDVKIQAHNPEMPLFPMKAFAGSPSSIRVRNVPSQIGKWKITGVTFSVVYPDGQVVPTDCVSINNIWVGTVPGTQATGRTINGYTIFASGKDENGNTTITTTKSLPKAKLYRTARVMCAAIGHIT